MLDSASRESASQAALLLVISSLSVRPKVVVCNIHFAGFSYNRYDFWHMKKVTSGISPTKMRPFAPTTSVQRKRAAGKHGPSGIGELRSYCLS
jgi:hypothetical protein